MHRTILVVLLLAVSLLVSSDAEIVQARMVTHNPLALPEPITPFRTRFALVDILNKHNMKIGAEIGVRLGHFSRWNLDHWPSCLEYVLVDQWNDSVVDHHSKHNNIHGVHSRVQHIRNENELAAAHNSSSEAKQSFQAAMGNLADYQDKLTICRDTPATCALRFPDLYFDFVYIDARRDRLSVIEDLKSYWPKVKYGGIIAGHDFVTQEEVGPAVAAQWIKSPDGSIHREETGEGVRGAVLAFFNDKRYADHMRQVVVAYQESHWHSWAVRK